MSDINARGANAAADLNAVSVSAATRNLQAFADEINEMSRQSIDHATETIEKLRNARGFAEVLAIQSSYIREAVDHVLQHTRRFSELMTSFPLELSKSYAEVWSQSVKPAITTTEEAGERAVMETERLSQPFRRS
ncbi:MAG: phasin family protein [Methylocella sp.]